MNEVGVPRAGVPRYLLRFAGLCLLFAAVAVGPLGQLAAAVVLALLALASAALASLLLRRQDPLGRGRRH